jgi:hypothetical protein
MHDTILNMEMVMKAKTMNEEQVVHMMRNAILVAGQEMGEGDEGDHWPVIKDTVHKIMKDWEDLKIERDVRAEMKKHIYARLDEMDKLLATSSEADRINDAPKLKEIREIYDAYFQPLDMSQITLSDEDTPIHIKRAKELILSLEGNHDD